jgi:NitT/TauT family transport system substrate-binding protein
MRFLLFLLALGFAPAASVAFAPAARAATPITILYTEATSFLGAYVGKDLGIFARHGLDVTLVAAPSSGGIPAALMGGSTQIAGLQTISLMQAVDGGLDLMIVAGTEPSPTPYRQGLLARAGSGIISVKDLPGHTLGVPGLGATLDILGRELMLRSGVDESRITRVEVPLPQLADALRTGSVDAVVAVDPSYARVLQMGATPVASFDTLIPAGTFRSVYACTRAWVRTNPQALAAFRAALAEADAFVEAPENETIVRQSFARWTHLPASVVAVSALPRKLTLAVTPASLQFWVDVAKDQRLTQEKVEPTALIAP